MPQEPLTVYFDLRLSQAASAKERHVLLLMLTDSGLLPVQAVLAHEVHSQVQLNVTEPGFLLLHADDQA